MRKTITMMMLMLIFSMATVSAAPIMKTTLLRYDPIPAQPGDYVTAYVQVENIGDSTTSMARIEFVDNYPFSMEDSKIDDIGTLGIGQSYIAEFKIRVDEDAIEGGNELKFKVTDNYVTGVTTDKVFPITVQTLDADVEITGVTVTPSEIDPGQKGKIAVTVKNKADSTLTSVSSILTLFTVHGTTVVDLPFAIEDSVSQKSVDSLKSKESTTFEYSIRSYPTIAPGIYKLPLTLTFFDGTGEEYTKNEFITIIVNPKVSLDILIESSTLTKEIRKGEIDIRIVNKGFGELKFFNMKLEDSDTYELMTPYDSIYIGNIDSDDYETTDFDILAKKDVVQIPITLEYMDSLNKEYTQSETLTLTLHSSNGGGTNYISILFWIAVIGGGGFWFFKRRKKKKK